MTDLRRNRRFAADEHRWRAALTVFAALAAFLAALGAHPTSVRAEDSKLIEIIGKPAPSPKARPPVPDGSAPIPATSEPGICGEGDGGDGYSPVYGYYWSKKANAWISRPRCYPRWGFLMMSPSQIVKPGKPVTMVATPTDGSNSGQYAPVTGTISWSYSGQVISGCGRSDLTCTILPNTTAGAEWQWFEVHVSMPKTFYVDDPGEFCAGRHLCAGATTNGWAFVGIPPKDFKGEIYGKATASDCSDEICRLFPLAGAEISATSGDKDEPDVVHAVTNAKGEYSLLVKEGDWTVTAAKGGATFEPEAKKVAVKADEKVGPVDFSTCASEVNGTDGAPASPALANCRLLQAEASAPAKGEKQAFNIYLTLDHWPKEAGDITIQIGDDKPYKLKPTGKRQVVGFGQNSWNIHEQNIPAACITKITVSQKRIFKRSTILAGDIKARFVYGTAVSKPFPFFICTFEERLYKQFGKVTAIYKPWDNNKKIWIFADGNYDVIDTPKKDDIACIDLIPKGQVSIDRFYHVDATGACGD